MIVNSLKQRLADKKACYGVISPTCDPTICEYVGLSGMDFYMIDAEHGALTPSDVAAGRRLARFPRQWSAPLRRLRRPMRASQH